MMIKIFLKSNTQFVRYVAFLLVCVSTLSAQPVLKFDEGFDWKQIFDAGFRPRHLNGGRRSCKVWKQESFFIEIKGLEKRMEFEEGSIDFHFNSQEKIIGFGHLNAEAIDMAEGKRRADELTAWLKPYVIHEMVMPPFIEGTYVDATADSSILVARIGEFKISYRFHNTHNPIKQLRPEFTIGWSFPGKPTDGFIPVDRKIKPPLGYEDWDMTEILPTSMGDIRVGEQPSSREKTQQENHASLKKQKNDESDSATNSNVNRKSFLFTWIAALLVVVAAISYALIQRSKNQSR